MTSSEKAIRDEAEALYDQRLEQLRQEAEREKEDEREQGIRSTIREIQQQRNDERKEQARREAKQRADSLARDRYELESRIEEEAASLLHSLTELRTIDQEQRQALQQAGEQVGSPWLHDVLPTWFRQRFGSGRAVDSVVGITSPIFEDSRSLPERDALARL